MNKQLRKIPKILNIYEYEPQNIIPMQVNNPNNKTTLEPIIDLYKLIVKSEQSIIRRATKIQTLYKLLIKFEIRLFEEIFDV
jgi:hypothetical protein